MPPKFKTSKEEIIEASLSIIKDGGISKLTAREIGHRLELSSRPIYSFYPSLEKLKEDVLIALAGKYEDFLSEKYSDDVFLNVGIGQILFARTEPHWYQMLHENIEGSILEHFALKESFISEMKKQSPYSRLSEQVLSDLFFKMGVFTDGLALSVSRGLNLSDNDVRRLLAETGTALIAYAVEQSGA